MLSITDGSLLPKDTKPNIWTNVDQSSIQSVCLFQWNVLSDCHNIKIRDLYLRFNVTVSAYEIVFILWRFWMNKYWILDHKHPFKSQPSLVDIERIIVNNLTFHIGNAINSVTMTFCHIDNLFVSRGSSHSTHVQQQIALYSRWNSRGDLFTCSDYVQSHHA